MHFWVRWAIRVSIRPFGKCTPHDLQVYSYLLLASSNLEPRIKNSVISWFGFRPIAVSAPLIEIERRDNKASGLWHRC